MVQMMSQQLCLRLQLQPLLKELKSYLISLHVYSLVRFQENGNDRQLCQYQRVTIHANLVTIAQFPYCQY